jgi:osmotically-inducible protein OsmY
MEDSRQEFRENLSLSPLAWFCAGALAGSVAMFFFDPASGRRRRALARDKSVHLSNQTMQSARKSARKAAHRASGLRARIMREPREVDDATLHERVRSAFGHKVSHSRAIEVGVEDGVITLAGPIIAEELEGLLDCVRNVEGVRRVINTLEVRDYLQ